MSMHELDQSRPVSASSKNTDWGPTGIVKLKSSPGSPSHVTKFTTCPVDPSMNAPDIRMRRRNGISTPPLLPKKASSRSCPQ